MSNGLNVLMINASPRINGNTSIALKEMEKPYIDKRNFIAAY